jgi:hypothetical protein
MYSEPEEVITGDMQDDGAVATSVQNVYNLAKHTGQVLRALESCRRLELCAITKELELYHDRAAKILEEGKAISSTEANLEWQRKYDLIQTQIKDLMSVKEASKKIVNDIDIISNKIQKHLKIPYYTSKPYLYFTQLSSEL